MSDCRPRGRSLRSSGLWSSWQSSSKGEARSATQRHIRELLEKTWIQIALFLLLSYVLFVNNVATIAQATDDSILAINISLIISFSVFCLEMALNFWTASKQDYLYMAMELIGTFSILLEVSWIAAWLGLNHSIEKESVSKTAIITSRAGRVTRMVRLIRFVRALKIFIMIRRYFARKIDDGGKERSMAPSSIGNCLNDRISLLAAFLVMVTMMVVSLLNPHDADEMNRAFMLTLSIAARDGSQESVAFMVQQIKGFIDSSDGGIILRKLLVGDWEWSWYESGYCFNNRDIVKLSRQGVPSVHMELDISEQNVTNAYLEILLGLAIIAELFVFVILLQRNTSQILITPLERIFSIIKQNASMIVTALDTSTNTHNADACEIDTIEAAISKMSKLVSHITPTGQQGNHVLKNYMQDENTSADTKAWLNDFAPFAKASSFKRNKSLEMELERTGLDRNRSKSRVMSEDDRKNSTYIARVMSSIDSAALDSWDFDVTQFTFEELTGALCLMFENLGLAVFAEDFSESDALVPMERLWEFLNEVKKYYHDVPYHNFFHCCDVAHATFYFIRLIKPRISMSSLESFALMVAAVCHDMDHPGLQNSFLVETKHSLATMYNDRSVLENRHVSCLYSLVLEHPEADVFYYLDESSWREVRKIIIEAILHTDMVKHFGMVSKVEIFHELHSAEIQSETVDALFDDPEDRLFLFALILHCADISNPVKPLSISEKWADNVLNEFFRQGDVERKRGLPVSPSCDRETTSRHASQINFLEFVVAPLYYHVVRIFPEMQLTMIHLKENRLFWDKLYTQEMESKGLSNRQEDIVKATKRLEAFLHKYKEVFDATSPLTSSDEKKALQE